MAPPAVPAHDAPVPRRRAIPVYVAVLAVLALGLGALTAELPPSAELPLLVALVACVLLSDLVDLDLFGRGTFTPGTVATIALAVAFGPFRPLVAEGAVAGQSLLPRKPLLRSGFDLALALCGIAAAGAARYAVAGGLGPIVAAVAGGCAYYVVNAVLLSTLWMLDERISPLQAWRERLAWAAPHYLGYGLLAGLMLVAERGAGLAVLAMAGVPFAILWLGQKQYLDRTRKGVEELRTSHAELEQAHETLRELLAEKEDLLQRIRQGLGRHRRLPGPDHRGEGPLHRGSHGAGRRLRRAPRPRARAGRARPGAVALGGVIHDIGKVGVRDDVLLKPGKLDPAQWLEMSRHPEIATYILDGLELPRIAKDIARHHHERFDGGGYPDALAGRRHPAARPHPHGRRHPRRDDHQAALPGRPDLRRGARRGPPSRGRAVLPAGRGRARAKPRARPDRLARGPGDGRRPARRGLGPPCRR